MAKKKKSMPTDPERVRAFAHFFKRYMSLSSVVTAALPIPITSFRLIPTFKAQTAVLSTYTPLFCFLLLGFIFYSRHKLARLMFPEYLGKRRIAVFQKVEIRMIRWEYLVSLLPALLIAISVMCVFLYHRQLYSAIDSAREDLSQEYLLVQTYPSSSYPDVQNLIKYLNKMGAHDTTMISDGVNLRIKLSSKDIMAITDQGEVPYGSILILYYLGIFVAAEAAFIVMAIKEYLQDLVGLTEMDLIKTREEKRLAK